MRDRSTWQAGLVDELEPYMDGPKPRLAASRLCEAELGLYLMEQLIPGHPAEAGWTLLGGYPFAHAIDAVTTPEQEQMLQVARHLLWPLRRPRSWTLALDRYAQVEERLRGYVLDRPGDTARRRRPAIAAQRWGTYAAALATPPPFVMQETPVAAPGLYRFRERPARNGAELLWTSVELPEALPALSGAEHELGTPLAGGGKPLRVRWDELADTAAWMDAELAARNEPPGRWAYRFNRVGLSIRDTERSGFTGSDVLSIDQMLHIVGMVGAGKSTLRDVLAVWAAQHGLRSTLVVSDVAEALHLVALFTSLGFTAAPVLGASTRERHVQRMHRRLAARGNASLLAHDSPAFDYLSTACPLDALRGVEAPDPLRFTDAPCASLYPARRKDQERRLSALAPPPDDEEEDDRPRSKRHSCPLWHQCPRHYGARELVSADIWVATPASLIHTAVPSQQNPERLRYLELACRRSDLIVVDEADRVQMQLDIMFAPATTLAGKAPNSWLDEVHARKIEELSRSGRTQLSDGDVRRWTAAVSSVTSATDRIYEILLMRPDIRRWVEADYFSAWTLQQKLIDEWFGPEEGPGQPDAADVLDRPGPEWDDPRHDEPAGQPPGDSTERSAGPSKDSGQRALVIKILDEFRDDPLGDTDKHSAEATALIQLTRHLLHATGTTNVRQLVREQLLALSGQQDPALATHATKKAGEDAKRKLGEQCRQFEFTLLLSVLHTRLDMMTDMWPRVEAALNLVGTSNTLSRRPPEDYRPLVPESPMGNILGFQFQPDSSSREPQSGELRFFRCAGSGRELLLGLPGLTAADGLPAPHVVLMSGTSWAGTSTRYHVLTEVGAILSPPQDELDAIDRTTFTTCFLKDSAGKPLKLSGTKPHLRPLVLEQMLSQLARPRPDGSASPMQAELAAIDDDSRRRLLLLTGSYDEARRAADYLETIERWAGRVCRLVSDDAEQDHLWREAAHAPSVPRGGPGALRRGDVATFAETGAEVLVAPLLAIERGHNILNDEGTAAIGSVFFLARPHPRPDDIGLAIQAVNDWAARMLRDGSFRKLVRDEDTLDAAGKEFRHQARAKWRHLLNQPMAYSRLGPEEKASFTWDQLVVIWQVTGRLVRGGVPARVVFVDSPFAERQARGLTGDTAETSLLASMLQVLAPYCGDHDGSEPAASGSPVPTLDRVLVTTLYKPLYAALSRLFPALEADPAAITHLETS
jgi:pPIWI RE three-gene island domain Z